MFFKLKIFLLPQIFCHPLIKFLNKLNGHFLFKIPNFSFSNESFGLSVVLSDFIHSLHKSLVVAGIIFYKKDKINLTRGKH